MTNFFLAFLFSIAFLICFHIPEYKDNLILYTFMIWLLLILYFAPTVTVCSNRDDKTLCGVNFSNIIFMFFANLLFGWTVLG